MAKKKHAGYPLLDLDFDGDGAISGSILCPSCKSKWVHPISVIVNPPSEHAGEVKIDANGLHIDTSVKRIGIATQLTLIFGCESGHVFAVKLMYCRGRTLGDLMQPQEPKVGHYRILGREDDPVR